MEAPFYPGQKIIRTGHSNRYVTKGNTYTCLNCVQCTRCGEWVVLILELPLGDDDRNNIVTCNNCDNIVVANSSHRVGNPKLFAPIEYADITADIAAGVTETKEQPDKVIIPAKPETAPCENSFS